jgi:hypothetical protein
LKPTSERERERECALGRTVEEYEQIENDGTEVRDTLIYGGRKSTLLLEGSQEMPGRLSDKDRIRMKTLGW